MTHEPWEWETLKRLVSDHLTDHLTCKQTNLETASHTLSTEKSGPGAVLKNESLILRDS